MAFSKGDARINRKGRPKGYDPVRLLAQRIAEEPAGEGDPRMTINDMGLSRDDARKLSGLACRGLTLLRWTYPKAKKPELVAAEFTLRERKNDDHVRPAFIRVHGGLRHSIGGCS